MPLEKLERPPIVEVICGIWFEPQSVFDPVFVGAYWKERKSAFSQHRVMPPLEPPGLRIGPQHHRVWLTSEDQAFVLQIQRDRLYLNWRARGSEYPRFSPKNGLRNRLLQEWKSFLTFCAQEGVQEPVATTAEVGKIDHFPETLDELKNLMPSLAGFIELAGTSSDVLARFNRGPEGRSTAMTLATAKHRLDHRLENILRLETTATAHVGDGGLEAALDDANGRVNEVFGRLIPKRERHARFGEGTP